MVGRWVVVADSVSAQIMEYRTEGLEVIHELGHAPSREHNRDLMGNRPNENQHGMEKDLKGNEAASLRDHESVRFAKDVAKYLATMHSRNQFRELVIVADPRFLGMLRAELSRPVAAVVQHEIDKRALGLKPEKVAELVEEHSP